MRTDSLGQPARLLSALMYLLALFVASALLTGNVLPAFNLRGAWLYTAAVSLIVNRFLIEPFFTRPADALATASVILIAVTTGSSQGSEIPGSAIDSGRYWFVAYSLIVLLLAAVAIFLKDVGWLRPIAGFCARIVGNFGRSDVGFGALMIATTVAAFAQEPNKLFVVLTLWYVMVEAAPFEAIFQATRNRRIRAGEVGTVEGVQDPRTLLGRVQRGAGVEIGSLVRVGPNRLPAIVVDVTRVLARPGIRATLSEDAPLTIGWPIYRDDSHPGRVVGWVEPGTETEAVVFRSEPRIAAELEEGELVQVEIGDRKALYQVINGAVTSAQDAGLQREALRITAQKLGWWDEHARAFRFLSWLPRPGTPVYVLEEEQSSFDSAAIGALPRTNFGIRLDPHTAVTHNAAIVGILGIGKTRLAWELIRRAMVSGVKVVVMDITGRYSRHFSDLFDPTTERSITDWINEETKTAIYSKKVFNGESGNTGLFRTKLRELLSAFAESESSLLVLNPSDLKVSRLEGFINRTGQADNLMLLTGAEVTAIVAETLLEVAQARDNPADNEAGKYWLVLEEAHSLVPERDATASSVEHRAAGATARAIMQGRKYGYGCLLITQRTANVVKSVLNQCNTVFGMRIYDATGIDFLSNYVGVVYAGLLPHLDDRQAVIFGRASSCNAPVIVRLNETEDVLRTYWPAAGSRVRPTNWDG